MSGTVFLDTIAKTTQENAGPVTIGIRRTGSLTAETSVTFGVSGDSATASLDYLGEGGTLTFAPGESLLALTIPILDDLLAEGSEVFSVTLITASGEANLAAPRTARITIADDEAPSPPPPAEPPLTAAYRAEFTPVVGGLARPIKMAFSDAVPGKLFIAEKAGVVRLADLETGSSTILLDLRDTTNMAGDRGLVGMVVHPDLESFPYLYVFHVIDPPDSTGQTGNAGPDGRGNRYSQLARYTLDEATGFTSVVEGSRFVLLGEGGQGLGDISGGGTLDFTDPAQESQIASDQMVDVDDWVIGGFKQDYLKGDSLSHNGGGMVFGADGALYVAVGDGTSYNFRDPRSPHVQALDSLSGKILRIDPVTGEGLPDNPFVTEGLDLDANRAKVFQLGLRNPFSLAVDPQGRMLVGDVGWFSFEEMNTAGPGANFGWPFFEADIRTPGYRDLPEAAPFYAAVDAGEITLTAPFLAFGHAAEAPGFQMQAIVGGGVVYDGDVYPAVFDHDLFFSDYVNSNVFAVDVRDPSSIQFVGNSGSGRGPVQMVQGPDGRLYYADIVRGQIGRMDIHPLPELPAQEWRALGAAEILPQGDWALTPVAPDAVGGVASTTRFDARHNASFTFDLDFGANNAAGAEGIALVLHNDPAGARALGVPGDGLGAAGLRQALTFRFDTFQSHPGQPRNDHLAIMGPAGLDLPGPIDLGNLEDGALHRLLLTWDAAGGLLRLTLDAAPLATLAIDPASIFGGPFFHLALSAATGQTGIAHLARPLAIDARYEDVAAAQAPLIFGGAARTLVVAENSGGLFHLPVTSDAEGDALAWRIAGGADAARFAIDAATGALSFRVAPDFEAPRDADRDNRYAVEIEARDASGLAATQALTVQVTDILVEPLRGSRGADTLTGARGPDRITGEAGHDVLSGGAGNDTFVATIDDGNDLIQGGAGGGDLLTLEETGADAVVSLVTLRASSAEIGADTLRGIEHVTGGDGHDSLVGNGGGNILDGQNGADTLAGGDGDDELFGGRGDDRLDGGEGADWMEGGAGNDTYIVDDPEDEVVEQARGGTDTVLARIDCTLPEQVEHLTLLAGATRGTGNALANRITGGAGADLLAGAAGNDTLIGGGGADTLHGGLGADRLEGNGLADAFLFGSPNEGGDTIIGYRAEDRLLVMAEGFAGLEAGMDVVAAGRYEANSMGLATLAEVGTFVFDTATQTLWWDVDGVGYAPGRMVAEFSGASGWHGGAILVI
jgi:Ca2+-binding RTX toxin-like protein/glucose/arabinose dehydrogenase